jgi:hypothetical protein
MKAEMILFLFLAAVGQDTAVAGVSSQDATDKSASAQEEKPKDIGAGRRIEFQELKQAAARYQIVAESDPPKTMVLAPEPILHWTNPLRRTSNGVVFIWVADGRPEAVASFYRYAYDGKTIEDHEFQSLMTKNGLTATRDGQTVWAPPTAGMSLATIPGAPRPAAAPAGRLRQMRDLAHEFRAFLGTQDDRSELRLLPKPLYRYEANRPGLLDGALFAFVVTTDPEVLLMIEARPGAADWAWHYGFARMSMVNLQAQHKDQRVWSADWVYDLEAPNKPYVTLRAPGRSN